MLPQSAAARNLLEDLLADPPTPDFPAQAARELLERDPIQRISSHAAGCPAAFFMKRGPQTISLQFPGKNIHIFTVYYGYQKRISVCTGPLV